MKDFCIGISLSIMAALVCIALREGDANRLDERDLDQYRKLLDGATSARIESSAILFSTSIADRACKLVTLDGVMGKSADKSALSGCIHPATNFLKPLLRRAGLLLGVSPILVSLVFASLIIGLHWRESSLDGVQWRSPMRAYFAKKLAYYVGVGGFVFFVLCPIVIPLWLVYVFVASLCCGVMVYVGSLGRV